MSVHLFPHCTRRDSVTDLICRFRWAALQLRNILALKIWRPHYIEEALYAMPKGLDKTYERVLGAIEDIHFGEARTALEWLAFSVEPVTVAQLAEACSISVDDAKVPFLEEGGHDAIVQLFGVISSLVLVDGTSINVFDPWRLKGFNEKALPGKFATTCYTEHVRLAHFSVKEYLISTRLRQSHDTRLSRYALQDTQVHQSLSRSCCEYFLYFASEPQMQTWIDEEKDPGKTQDYMEDFLPAYPLLRYVCLHWRIHQGLAETGIGPLPTNGQLHISILDDERMRISWLRLTVPRSSVPGSIKIHSRWPRRTKKLRDGTKALYWASALGLRQTVSMLRDSTSNFDVCHVGGKHHTALQAAARYGHEEIVDILIASGPT
jgi:hypothetical protein